MEDKLSKNEAMLHLIWLVACADKEDESFLKKHYIIHSLASACAISAGLPL